MQIKLPAMTLSGVTNGTRGTKKHAKPYQPLTNSAMFRLDLTNLKISHDDIYTGVISLLNSNISALIRLYQLGDSRTWCLRFNNQFDARTLFGTSFTIKDQKIDIIDPNKSKLSTFILRVHWLPDYLTKEQVTAGFQELVGNSDGIKAVSTTLEHHRHEHLKNVENGNFRVRLLVPETSKQKLLGIVGINHLLGYRCRISIVGIPQCSYCHVVGHTPDQCPSKNQAINTNTNTYAGMLNKNNQNDLNDEMQSLVDGLPSDEDLHHNDSLNPVNQNNQTNSTYITASAYPINSNPTYNHSNAAQLLNPSTYPPLNSQSTTNISSAPGFHLNATNSHIVHQHTQGQYTNLPPSNVPTFVNNSNIQNKRKFPNDHSTAAKSSRSESNLTDTQNNNNLQVPASVYSSNTANHPPIQSSYETIMLSSASSSFHSIASAANSANNLNSFSQQAQL